jgi:hypothetical protein
MNLNWFQLKGCSHRYTSSGVARQVTEFHHLRGSTLLNTATTALDSILLVPTVHARRTTRPIPLKLHNLRQSRRILVREIRPRHRPPHTCPCTTFLFQYPRRHTLYLQRIQTRRRCLNEPGHRRIKSLLFVLLAVPIPRHPRWSGCLHRPNPGDALRPPSSYQPPVFSPACSSSSPSPSCFSPFAIYRSRVRQACKRRLCRRRWTHRVHPVCRHPSLSLLAVPVF